MPEFLFGTPVPLAAGAYGSTKPAFARNPDVDPSGRRFITFVAADDSPTAASATEILVVLNWFDELKQRVPRQ